MCKGFIRFKNIFEHEMWATSNLLNFLSFSLTFYFSPSTTLVTSISWFIFYWNRVKHSFSLSHRVTEAAESMVLLKTSENSFPTTHQPRRKVIFINLIKKIFLFFSSSVPRQKNYTTATMFDIKTFLKVLIGRWLMLFWGKEKLPCPI